MVAKFGSEVKSARAVHSLSRCRSTNKSLMANELILAHEKIPALILMDIQLSGMDGITAMKQLKAAPKTKSIPIVAITASAMTHNRQTMLAEGFDGYQTKPLSLKEFLGELERLIAKQDG